MNSNKITYALNPKNLALLGLLDDFYQLYYDVDQIYSNEFEQSEWNSDIDKKVRNKIRNLLDGFFKVTTYVFTQEYPIIHPNTISLNIARAFVDVKHPQPLRLEYKMVAFGKFLTVLQDMVAVIIQQRKRHEKTNITIERATELINENILLLIGNCYTDHTPTPTAEPDRLIVFKSLSHISCNVKRHIIDSDIVLVETIKDNKVVKLPIHSCKTCGRLFIGAQTLTVFEEMYGRMLIRTTADVTPKIDSFDYFNSESELHQYGYNVVEGELSESERHTILIRLLETKKMTEFQIKRDIENAIRLFCNDSRFVNAVPKWKKDLIFLSEFSLTHQITNNKKD